MASLSRPIVILASCGIDRIEKIKKFSRHRLKLDIPPQLAQAQRHRIIGRSPTTPGRRISARCRHELGWKRGAWQRLKRRCHIVGSGIFVGHSDGFHQHQ
jgi:hypothetical protein